jgi:hypothetical protein
MISSEQASQFALGPALSLFAELLERRLKRGVFTTEDAVRYTFFTALVQALNLQPEDIVLEHDHGAIARAKIDTWIPSFDDRAYGIEFKYDRPIPSGKNAPLTQKAGQVIKDMFRLAKIEATLNAETIFVYLATREMAGYFSNPNNGLADLFELGTGASLRIDSRYLANRPETFRGAAGEVVPCTITSLCSRELSNAHRLRVFNVRPAAVSPDIASIQSSTASGTGGGRFYCKSKNRE